MTKPPSTKVSNMRFAKILLLSTLTLGKVAVADDFSLKETDLYTFSCIKGLDYAEMQEFCSMKYPELKSPLEQAMQGWRSRNSEALKEVANACAERMQKLAEQDADRLEKVKKYAEQMSATPFANRPGYREESIGSNCRALAEDFSDPKRSVIPPGFAAEIRKFGIK